MLSPWAESPKHHGPAPTYNAIDYLTHTSREASRLSDDRAEFLERALLIMFVVMASIGVLWHLGTGVVWLWTNCASQLHSAVAKAGIA